MVPTTVNVVDPTKDAGKYTPKPQDQTVNVGDKVDPAKSISNLDELPQGTKVELKDPVDTSTAGEKPAEVVVTYPDGSEDVVSSTITVVDPRTDADKNDPQGQDITADKGSQPNPEDAIVNKDELPEGTKYTWKETPDTATPGDHPAVVVVTYPDGSVDEVPVTVKVPEDKDTGTIADKIDPKMDSNISVNPGETKHVAAPTDQDGNPLPEGTTCKLIEGPSWLTANEDCSLDANPGSDVEPGEYPYTLEVTYPDGSKDLIHGVVTVGDPNANKGTTADSLEPKYKDLSVKAGESQTVPAPTDQNGNPLPEGTKLDLTSGPEWLTLNSDGSLTASPGKDVPAGDYGYTIKVTYPDGSVDYIKGSVRVTDADKSPVSTASRALANTGASVLGLVGAAGVLTLAGVALFAARRKKI